MESNKSAHLILLEKSWKFFKNFHLRKMSVGQKSLWIFAPRSKTDKRREQNQHYALLRSQQLLRAKALRVEGPSEISRNYPKIKKQFSEISSYFSELNGSVPTSLFLILLILNGISRNDL